jgi:very-short-patch-repair endonuclease
MLRARNKHANAPRVARDSLLRVGMLLSLGRACRLLRSTRFFALNGLARQMRRLPTRSESILWNALRNRQLLGVKFRRQHVIGRYIVDVAALSHRLVVEVDGGVHRDSEERDAAREAELVACGFRVVRVDAEVVESGLADALAVIAAAFG